MGEDFYLFKIGSNPKTKYSIYNQSFLTCFKHSPILFKRNFFLPQSFTLGFWNIKGEINDTKKEWAKYIYMVEITDSFCKPKSRLIVRWLVLKIQRHDSRE